jgi:hypothetical protein
MSRGASASGPVLRLGVFAEVSEKSDQAAGDRGVPFGLAGPAVLAGVVDELLLDLQPGSQPWGVLAGGDELGAGQVEVAFTRALGRQAQAVAELELGLEEIGLQPVHGLVGQDAGLQVERGGAGDDGAGRQDGLVVAQDPFRSYPTS